MSGSSRADEQRGDLDVVAELVQEPVEPGEEIAEVFADARVRTRGMTELRHQARRAQSVPADVADREHDPAVGQEEGVVPVAADLTGVVFGGEVARRDVERVEGGEAGPDQRLLQNLDRAALPGQAFPRREQRRLGRPLFGDVLERAAYCHDLVVVEQDLAPVHHLADVAVDEEPALHHVAPPATPERLVGRSGELRGVVGMRGASATRPGTRRRSSFARWRACATSPPTT